MERKRLGSTHFCELKVALHGARRPPKASNEPRPEYHSPHWPGAECYYVVTARITPLSQATQMLQQCMMLHNGQRVATSIKYGRIRRDAEYNFKGGLY